MEDTMTQNKGLENAGSVAANLGNKASNMADRAKGMVNDTAQRAKETVGQYLDTDPKAHPRE